jgi:hypothetical protein
MARPARRGARPAVQGALPGGSWQQLWELLAWARRCHGYASGPVGAQLELSAAACVMPACYELQDRLLLQVGARAPLGSS